MSYCTQCGEKNIDGAVVCVKCSSALPTGGVRQQQSYERNNGASYPPTGAACADSDPVTIGEWMITYLITLIPLVNIVLVCIWAFDSNTKPSKKNWAKASLIWMAIGIAIMILLIIMFGAVIIGALSNVH